MHRSASLAVALAALWCVVGSSPAHAQPRASITVRRLDGDSVALSAATLAPLARRDVSASEHGRAATFSGYLLRDVLRATGVRVDSLRGPALSTILLVDAADGYRVAFSLGELSADLGGRPVMLVDRRDGAELAANEGPYRLVIAEDGRPARWVRRVTRLTVVQLAAGTGAPATGH